MSEILAGRIYLGGAADVNDLNFLQSAKITGVVSCQSCFDEPVADPSIFPCGIKHFVVYFEDTSLEPVVEHFAEVYRFMASEIGPVQEYLPHRQLFLDGNLPPVHNIGRGCVLIHCRSGVSRSPTVAVALIMMYLDLTLRDAFLYVIKRRPVICPNIGLMRQLCVGEVEKHFSKICGLNEASSLSEDDLRELLKRMQDPQLVCAAERSTLSLLAYVNWYTAHTSVRTEIPNL